MNDLFMGFREMFQAQQQEEMSLTDYLELCRSTRLAYATPHERMLEAGVVVLPGSALGAGGEGFFRVSFIATLNQQGRFVYLFGFLLQSLLCRVVNIVERYSGERNNPRRKIKMRGK